MRYFKLIWKWRLVLVLLLVAGFYAWQFFELPIPEAKAAYSISASARFNDDDSANLNRTPAGAGNRQTWTLSTWLKRGNLTSQQFIFQAGNNGSNDTAAYFQLNSDKIDFYDRASGTLTGYITTSAVYRDPAAWLHFVFVFDSTNTTAADRMHIYVNNVRQDVTINNTLTQNTNAIMNSATTTSIGINNGTATTKPLDGYLSDVYLIDGQALTPSSFGETDSNGYWRPKSYTGTYGTNGFKLDFASGSDLGNDVSGNNNDFTVNSMDATDWIVDTPTNGYATGNPIAPGGGTYSQGNLQNSGNATSTVLMASGKWYWEVYANGAGVSAGVVSAAGVSTVTSISNTATTGFFFDADAGTLNVTTNGSTYTSVATGLSGGRFAYVTGGSTIVNYGQSKNSTSTATTLTLRSTEGGYFLYNPTASLSSNSGALTLSSSRTEDTTQGVENITSSASSGQADVVVNNGATFAANDRVLIIQLRGTGAGNYEFKRISSISSNTLTMNSNLSSTYQSTGAEVVKLAVYSSVTINSGGSWTASTWNGTKGGVLAAIVDGNLTVNSSGSITVAGNGFRDGAANPQPTCNVGELGTQGESSTGAGTTATTANGQGGGGASCAGGGGGGASGGGGGHGTAGAIGGGCGTSCGSGSTPVPGDGGSTAGGANLQSSNLLPGGGGGGAAGGSAGAGAAGGGVILLVVNGNITVNTGASVNAGGSNAAIGANTRSGGSGAGGAVRFISSGTVTLGTNLVTATGGTSEAGSLSTGGSGGSGRIATLSGASVSGTTNPSIDTTSTETISSLNVPLSDTTSFSGYKALSTSNLPVPTVTIPKQYFDAKTYQGTGAAATTTGISFQPSLVWLKATSTVSDHGLFDSIRGIANVLISNRTNAELASSTSLTAFNSDGFSLGTDGTFNTNAKGYISWLWKESATSGFDVVTYTGNGANRTISHSLGAAPDFIIVKDRLGGQDWAVYHAANTAAPATDYLLLNSAAATADDNTYWNDTAPTASVFSLGNNPDVNDADTSFRKLLLHADGSDGSTTFTDSSASPHTVTPAGNAQIDTAQSKFGGSSILFDGAGDYLTLDGSSDFAFGTGDFTIDFWLRPNTVAGTHTLYDSRNSADQVAANIYQNGSSLAYFVSGADRITGGTLSAGTWHHVAVARSGTATKMFLDGTQAGSTYTDTNSYINNTSRPSIGIAGYNLSDFSYDGWIDEVRVSKGIAHYTSNFTAPIAAHGDDDNYVAYLFASTTGFSTFGSYTGNGAADGPFVFTNFKPRFLMVKRTDTTGDWTVLDSARDIYNAVSATTTANTALADGSNTSLDFLVNGFKLRSAQAAYNASGGTYIYAAFAEIPFKYSAASAGSSSKAKNLFLGMSF